MIKVAYKTLCGATRAEKSDIEALVIARIIDADGKTICLRGCLNANMSQKMLFPVVQVTSYIPCHSLYQCPQVILAASLAGPQKKLLIDCR